MDSTNCIGMDVHKESISIAVMNGAGKIVMECVIETKASTILQFIQGLSGSLHVTFEEGTWAAWLYDLLKPHVAKLVVCDPRKNASMKEGDKIDARRLAELLRLNHINPVYHGEHGLRSLKELVRSYLTIKQWQRTIRPHCRLTEGQFDKDPSYPTLPSTELRDRLAEFWSRVGPDRRIVSEYATWHDQGFNAGDR